MYIIPLMHPSFGAFSGLKSNDWPSLSINSVFPRTASFHDNYSVRSHCDYALIFDDLG